jgi:hypothetical protein
VPALFGNAGYWEPSLVRDADMAVRGQPKQAPIRSESPRMKTHACRVTAACAARESGDVFLGFEDGTLAHYNPRRGSCATWQPVTCRIVGLATDVRAQAVVFIAGPDDIELYSSGTFTVEDRPRVLREGEEFRSPRVPTLAPLADSNGDLMAAMVTGSHVIFLSLPDLLVVERWEVADEFFAALLRGGWQKSRLRDFILLLGRRVLSFPLRNGLQDLPLPACLPTALEEVGSSISWLAPAAAQLEMAFVEESGIVHWMLLQVPAVDPCVIAHHQSGTQRYLCATLLRPGQVAAVHRDGVAWLARGETGFVPRNPTPAPLADAVACFASPVTNELLVVLAKGDLVRVPLPR